jgi:hypothetical protein
MLDSGFNPTMIHSGAIHRVWFGYFAETLNLFAERRYSWSVLGHPRRGDLPREGKYQWDATKPGKINQ